MGGVCSAHASTHNIYQTSWPYRNERGRDVRWQIGGIILCPPLYGMKKSEEVFGGVACIQHTGRDSAAAGIHTQVWIGSILDGLVACQSSLWFIERTAAAATVLDSSTRPFDRYLHRKHSTLQKNEGSVESA